MVAGWQRGTVARRICPRGAFSHVMAYRYTRRQTAGHDGVARHDGP
jgi:hypothetical protein